MNNQTDNHEGFHALLIIPPSQSSQDLVGTMEVAIQSMVLDKQHPIALEVVGTANKPSFVIRATQHSALDHVEALLRAEYPQIEIQPLQEKDDPFRLDADETVSAVELMTEEKDGAYASPRPFREERDPLLRLLAVLSKLPDHTRAIVQIGLAPVSSTVTTRILGDTGILGITGKLVNTGFLGFTGKLGSTSRLSSMSILGSPSRLGLTSGLSNPGVLAFLSSRRNIAMVAMLNALLLAVLLPLAGPWLPGWLLEDLAEFIQWGQFPSLAMGQAQQLVWCAIAFLLVEALFFYGTIKVIKRFFLQDATVQVSDQDASVIDTTSAYRTRIRFYVIGPKAADEAKTLPRFITRYLTPLEKDQEGILLRMIATYRQFHAISGIAIVPKQIPPKTAHQLLRPHGWQQGLLQSDNLMSFRSLATLWHLPRESQLLELGIQSSHRTRTLALPPEIAVQPLGVDQSTGLAPIGYSEHGGNRLPFHLPKTFFSHNTLIAGKSAEGKSAFMRHLAHSAMEQGGLVLVDPYGDLCEDVLKIVPAQRSEDVIFIDLSESHASIGLNPLDVTLGRGRDKTISDLLKMLAHIWVSSWRPKMENVFEMSLRTLFEANKIIVAYDPQNGPKQQYTLLDISPLLTNAKFCHSVLQLVQDDYLHRWWREYYEPLSFAQQREIINPLITKVAKFESTSARRIIGQGASTLNVAEMIAERKIILLKLAKGTVGSEIASLVGATVLGLVQLALEEQSLQGKSHRSRVHLPIIIDEFEMLLGTDYGALSELRKHGASFLLSCQSLEYIQKSNPLLLSTVRANVKQLMAFHMSAQDAELVHKELEVKRDDLIHLDMHSCYIAILAADRRQPTFSLTIASPPKADAMLAESIRTRCHIRYTYPVDEIDEMLRNAMIRTIRQMPAPLPKERERRSEELPLDTSSDAFISKKTRLLMNDTQRLPFTRELSTGELETPSRQRYRSRAERPLERRRKERQAKVITEALESTDGREITKRLTYDGSEDKETGNGQQEQPER